MARKQVVILRGQPQSGFDSRYPPLQIGAMMRLANKIMGYFSPRSHYTRAGREKVAYGSRATAEKAVVSMSKKTNSPLEAYRCWVYCRKWHIGRVA